MISGNAASKISPIPRHKTFPYIHVKSAAFSMFLKEYENKFQAPKSLSPPVEFVAIHMIRHPPIPIHILRKTMDSVLANTPQKNIVTVLAKK